VGLAIADKSGDTVTGESITVSTRGNGALPNRLALRQILGLATLATFRTRGMKSTRPTSAAHAKKLGENKGVADNGLTNTNEHILSTTNDDPR
jgi:hypothetical protein